MYVFSTVIYISSFYYLEFIVLYCYNRDRPIDNLTAKTIIATILMILSYFSKNVLQGVFINRLADEKYRVLYKNLMVCDIKAIERFRFYGILDRLGTDIDQLQSILGVDVSNAFLSIEHIFVCSLIIVSIGIWSISLLALAVIIAGSF